MSSLLPSSSQINANLNTGNNTLQRSAVNNAAADALRKKMQQLRDELELVKDDLERSRKEYEKEQRAREVVCRRSCLDFFCQAWCSFRPMQTLVN